MLVSLVRRNVWPRTTVHGRRPSTQDFPDLVKHRRSAWRPCAGRCCRAPRPLPLPCARPLPMETPHSRAWRFSLCRKSGDLALPSSWHSASAAVSARRNALDRGPGGMSRRVGSRRHRGGRLQRRSGGPPCGPQGPRYVWERDFGEGPGEPNVGRGGAERDAVRRVASCDCEVPVSTTRLPA